MGKTQNLGEGGAQNRETPKFIVKMPRFGACSHRGLEARQEFQLLGFAEDFLLIPLSCSLDHLETPKSRILTPKFTALTLKFIVLNQNLAFFTQFSVFYLFFPIKIHKEIAQKVLSKFHKNPIEFHKNLTKF